MASAAPTRHTVVLGAIATLALAVLGVTLGRLDFGFYNPVRGEVAAGSDATPEDPHAREMLAMTVTADDVRRFGRVPTLEQLVRFYGAADALRCTLKATLNTELPAAAQRSMPAGSEIRLCLN